MTEFETDRPVVRLSVSTRTPEKWLLIDTGTGQMYRGSADELQWHLAEDEMPVFEYGFHDEWMVPAPVTFASAEDAREWLDGIKRRAEDYVMMRRRKAGPWEDVQ